MSDGRPINAFEFSQEPSENEESVDLQPAAPPASQEDRGETRLHNSLLSEGHWVENPYVSDQEARFPNSVRTHAVTFRLFNVAEPKDMMEYSKIHMSDAKRGRYVFAGHEQIQWDLPNARCFILVRVEERRFLGLSTANTNPNED